MCVRTLYMAQTIFSCTVRRRGLDGMLHPLSLARGSFEDSCPVNGNKLNCMGLFDRTR